MITRDGRIAYKLVGPVTAANLQGALAPQIEKALGKSERRDSILIACPRAPSARSFCYSPSADEASGLAA